MKRYDSYKDSEVEWIREIPSGWEELPLRYYFSYTKGSNGQKLTKTFIENNKGDYPVYSGQTENNGVLGFVNEFEFDYPFPLVFTTTVGAKFMTTKLLKGKFSLSQNCLVMIKKRECTPSFFQYFLSFDFENRRVLIPTIIQPSLRMEDLDRMTIIVPPLSEQQQIVSFLDTKTSLIDSLIEKTQRKIELLKEKRTSLINEVVTKGLNTNVEMKDSGVEWIGEIPSHWYCVGTNKVYHDLGTGTTPTSDNSEYYSDNGYHWITTTDLNEGIMLDTLSKITEKSVEDYPNLRLYPSGSIYISMYGGRIGKLGVSTFDSYCNQSVCVLPKNDTIIVKFYYYWFLGFQEFVKGMGRGGGQPNINKDMIKSFPTVKIPLSEQQQIVEYLDEQTQLIDKTISIEGKRIELLKEYRQSLISEVVTGKLKVTTDE